MDYTGITFGIDVLVSVVFGAGGAMGVYFSMKGRIDLAQQNQNNFMANTKKEIAESKEDNNYFRVELKNLSDKVDLNQQMSDKSTADLKEFILQIKIDIIQEIHANR